MPSGDCLSCRRLSGCPDTTPEKVQANHTCPRFLGVEELVYRARLEAMRRFGDHSALQAMITRTEEKPETTEEEGPEDE